MRVEGLIQRAKRRHGFSAADISDPLKANYAGITFFEATEAGFIKRSQKGIGLEQPKR